jgi:hypothetical protein
MTHRRLIVSLIMTVFVAGSRCWADAPVNERTIRAFHCSDFFDSSQSVVAAAFQTVFNGIDSGIAWTPLFDGSSTLTGASLLLDAGGQRTLFGGPNLPDPQNVTDCTLLAVDNPQIGPAGATLVGRWSSPKYHSYDVEGLDKIAMTLKIEYANATSDSVVTHLVDSNNVAANDRDFRLPCVSRDPPQLSSDMVRKICLPESCTSRINPKA